MLTLALALFSTATLSTPDFAGPRQARVEIDITGDGRREIFVARDYQGLKAGDDFEVLSPQADGALKPFGHIAFNLAMGFRADIARRRLFVLTPGSAGEATRFEYAIEPGLPRVGELRLAQSGATEARYDDEFKALDIFWTGARAVQAYADSADEAGEPVWKDLDCGAPVQGMRRLRPRADEKATPAPTRSPAGSPAAPPSLVQHFAGKRLATKGALGESELIWLIELDVTGDGVPETLLAASSGSGEAGFMIYTQSGEGYRFIGSARFRPLTFRFDAKEKLLIDEDPAHPDSFLAFSITESGARRVRRPGLPDNPVWVAAQREAARRFRDQCAGQIMAAPYAFFEADPAHAAWRSLVNDAPAAPATIFSKSVLNP